MSTRPTYAQGGIFSLAAGLALFMLAPALGSDGDKKPAKAAIGIYLLDVYNLDLKNSSYVADFYIWLRWEGAIDPRNFRRQKGSGL